MKATLKTLMVGLLFASSCASVYAGEYEDTKKMFVDAGIANMFSSAYGYALFPTIGKAGFLVGGAYGKGRVYKQGKFKTFIKFIVLNWLYIFLFIIFLAFLLLVSVLLF